MKSLRWFWLLPALMMLVACSDPDRDLSRLEAPKEEDGPETPEEERLRRLQLVTGDMKVRLWSACCGAYSEADLLQYLKEGTYKDSGTDIPDDPIFPAAESVRFTGEPEQELLDDGRCARCTFPLEVTGAVENGWDGIARDTCARSGTLQGASYEVGVCEHLEFAEDYLCAASRLREMGQVRASTFGLIGDQWNYGDVTIPPQSSAANVATLRGAQKMARQAAVEARSGMQKREWVVSGAPWYCAEAMASGTAGYEHVTEVNYASSFVDAYHLHGEITDELVDATIAVADAQRSWSSSVRQGVEWSVGGTALSRVAAAHDLVGGDEGLFLNASASGGFCTSPELTGQAQKAITIIREAAPDPLDVLAIPGAPWLDEYNISAVKTDTLVNSIGALPHGSLRERLAGKYPEIQVEDPTGGGTLVGLGEIGLGIESFFRLETGDFDEARAYLAQEIRAFSRSLTAVINPVTTRSCASGCSSGVCVTRARAVCEGKGVFCDSDSDCTDGAACITDVCETRNFQKRFAATAGPPMGMPDVYWATMAQYSETFEGQSLELARDRASFVGSAMDVAYGLVADANLEEPVKRVLDLLLADRPTVQLGRVSGLLAASSSELSYVSVDGFGPADGLRLVRGEDGLRCAVTASIETAPCDLNLLTYATFDDATAPPVGYTKGVSTQYNAPEQPTNLYLVKPNDPNDVTPGSFTALAGFNTGVDRLLALPIVPHLYSRAAAVLKPSRKFCTSSSVSCAGFEFDERMPLENELTDDEDEVESSWRHYLALARQAADEADALGQAYVQSGLDVDVRDETLSIREQDKRLLVEQELEELQNICGMAMGTERLLSLLSQGSSNGELDLSDLRGEDCSSMPCPEGKMCVVDTCVWDPSELARQHPEDPDLLRLATCLGTRGDKKFVTIGNVPLCLFTREGNPYRPCDGWVGQDNCPGLPDDPQLYSSWPGNATLDDSDDFVSTGMCDDFIASTVPDGQEEHATVALPLGYFDILEDPLPRSIATNTCDAIRGLRAALESDPGRSVAKDDLLSTVRGSGLFSKENRRDFARKVGWSPILGGGSAVSLDQQDRYSVELDRVTSSWPCNGQPLAGADCGPGRSGLFCSTYDCTDPASVGELSQRLAEAVAAFIWTNDVAIDTGLMDNVTIPQYAYLPPDVEPNWSAVSGNPGVERMALPFPQSLNLSGTTYFRYTGPDPAPPAWIAPDGTALPFQDSEGRYFAISNNGSFSRGSLFKGEWRCGGTRCDIGCWSEKAPTVDIDAYRERYQVDPVEAECDDVPSCLAERLSHDASNIGGYLQDAWNTVTGVFRNGVFAPGDPGSHFCFDPRPENPDGWWFGLQGSQPLLTASEWKVESTSVHRGYFHHMWAGHSQTSTYFPFPSAFQALDAGIVDVRTGLGSTSFEWPFLHQGTDSWIHSERLPPDIVTGALDPNQAITQTLAAVDQAPSRRPKSRTHL